MKGATEVEAAQKVEGAKEEVATALEGTATEGARESTEGTTESGASVIIHTIMTKPTAISIGVSDEEWLIMEKQTKKLENVLQLVHGLSGHAQEVCLAEATFALDIKSRAQDNQQARLLHSALACVLR